MCPNHRLAGSTPLLHLAQPEVCFLGGQSSQWQPFPDSAHADAPSSWFKLFSGGNYTTQKAFDKVKFPQNCVVNSLMVLLVGVHSWRQDLGCQLQSDVNFQDSPKLQSQGFIGEKEREVC